MRWLRRAVSLPRLPRLPSIRALSARGRDVLTLLTLLSIVQGARSISVRQPENMFSRGSLDYSTLLLDPTGAALFVGARGHLFRLWAYNVNDTAENMFSAAALTVSDADTAECVQMGNARDDCAVSVRNIFHATQRQQVIVCSSAAMKPEMRVLDSSTLSAREPPATVIGVCSPDAGVNTTAIYVEWGNPRELPAIYSGIRTGMAGENHLIYRPALTDNGKEVVPSMRTVYTDNKWLNEPQFVGSFAVGEHVYFFLREIAVESGLERGVYSRVARVCKRDVGGKNVLRQVWTSLVKARLNCSISAQQPFYFDHIQSVTRAEVDGDTVFYAAMSTSETAYPASAVCAFSLKTINQVLDHGVLLEQSGSSWQPLSPDAVPTHRPGTCVPDSKQLSDSDIHFAKTHLLLADSVSGGEPLFTTRDAVFSHIEVDTKTDKAMVFAVDANSRALWRALHWREGGGWRSRRLERSVLEGTGRIMDTALLPGEFLYTASPSGVQQWTLAACVQISGCAQCAADPLCSWNVARQQCYAREKQHSHSVGWISNSPSSDRECAVSSKPVERKVYPGDAVHMQCDSDGEWSVNGQPVREWRRHVLTGEGGLILMEVQKRDNGDYTCRVDGRVWTAYRVVVDHEDCAKPKTVESYRAAQREWCKKLDGYKKSMAKWQTWFDKNQQCPLGQNGSAVLIA